MHDFSRQKVCSTVHNLCSIADFVRHYYIATVTCNSLMYSINLQTWRTKNLINKTTWWFCSLNFHGEQCQCGIPVSWSKLHHSFTSALKSISFWLPQTYFETISWCGLWMCALPMSSNVECVLLSTMANSVWNVKAGLHVGLGGVGEESNCIIKLFI